MFNLSTSKTLLFLSGLSYSFYTSSKHPELFYIFNRTFINVLKNSSSPFILISSLQRSTTLLLLLLSLLKIACLYVSSTAYENFYKVYKMRCLLVLFSTFYPSEVSENRNSTIKHISTCTLFHPSISTYVVDHFLVISCP